MPNQDERYRPTDVSQSRFDYENDRFNALNIGEIFWLTKEDNRDNHAFRKLDDNSALNTKTQEVHQFKAGDNVFYKM